MDEMRGKMVFIICLLFFIFILCSYVQGQKNQVINRQDLGIQANMVFFYYKDMLQAAKFYEDILGLRLVLDYGFARAYQISQTSFVCLVDETKGMHNTSEPKTVTLSFITREIDDWYKHLTEKGIKMHSLLRDATRHPTRGFVAYDPEGYFLEFETFLNHPQNTKILAKLEQTSALYPQKEQERSRPKELGVQGNVIWLYYKDMKQAQRFYRDVLGFELLVDQGFAKVYSCSPTAFIGLVDESQGLHHFSEKKSVNIGFFTQELDAWYNYLINKGQKMRGSLDGPEEELVRAFVTYDVARYYLKFDKFQKHEKNKTLLEILNK